MKENRSEHGGSKRHKVKTERLGVSAVKDRQAEEEERLVKKQTANVILHSIHGVQGRRVRDGGGMGEGREG